MQRKLSNEWSHDMVWDRIQKSTFWSTGTLTTIYGVWGLGTLRGVSTQLFCQICVLHLKWPLLNWWPKKIFPNIPPSFWQTPFSFALGFLQGIEKDSTTNFSFHNLCGSFVKFAQSHNKNFRTTLVLFHSVFFIVSL